jgi:hypothetical protein
VSRDRIIELLFNKDSEDDLIPESSSSESSDSEMPESPEIALISDVADEATSESSPGYYPPLASSIIYSRHRAEYRRSEQ